MKPTAEQIERTVATISATRYFPSDNHHVRAELLELLADMVGTGEQMDWMRRVFRDQITEWPGLAEVRAVFCTRFRPADGIEGKRYSTVAGFTAGDIETESITARKQRYLPQPGDEPIGDLKLLVGKAVKQIA